MASSGKSSKHRKRTVIVVAHDAGGAEVIAAYIRRYRNRARYKIYVAGPARPVFQRNGLSVSIAPRTTRNMRALMRKNRDCVYALLGTGWMTNIEANALAGAKGAGIKTVVYLDSWINYREVFGYPKKGWRKNLPDEFWTGDTAARALATKYFPRTKIHLVKNEYLAGIIRRFHAHSAGHLPQETVFMSAHGKISERLLADFLAACEKHRVSRMIRIRLHPADNRARYERIAQRYPHAKTLISREKDIARDISCAHIVVGPETVALVPAMMLGIKAVRIVPRGEKAFLPFQKIRIVRAADAAAGLVK